VGRYAQPGEEGGLTRIETASASDPGPRRRRACCVWRVPARPPARQHSLPFRTDDTKRQRIFKNLWLIKNLVRRAAQRYALCWQLLSHVAESSGFYTWDPQEAQKLKLLPARCLKAGALQHITFSDALSDIRIILRK